jgi:hypothetical protein
MSYQFSDIKTLGDKSYFGLSISNTEGRFAPFSRYVFLTDYSEDFSAVWTTKDRVGRIDPDFKYASTNRRANLSFTLPAKNVAEAKENLDFCSKLAKTVYGSYAETGEETVFGNTRYRFDGATLTNKLKFGNLIRNEYCFFTDFSFTPNLDAGVFEYSGQEIGLVGPNGGPPKTVGQTQTSHFSNNKGPDGLISEIGYVYHDNKGDIYPKEVGVTISIIIHHYYPLGFGGPRRLGEPLKWAENKVRDWPHGTGPTYPVPPYMSPTDPPISSSKPKKDEIQTIQGRKVLIGKDGRITFVD